MLRNRRRSGFSSFLFSSSVPSKECVMICPISVRFGVWPALSKKLRFAYHIVSYPILSRPCAAFGGGFYDYDHGIQGGNSMDERDASWGICLFFSSLLLITNYFTTPFFSCFLLWPVSLSLPRARAIPEHFHPSTSYPQLFKGIHSK